MKTFLLFAGSFLFILPFRLLIRALYIVLRPLIGEFCFVFSYSDGEVVEVKKVLGRPHSVIVELNQCLLPSGRGVAVYSMGAINGRCVLCVGNTGSAFLGDTFF